MNDQEMYNFLYGLKVKVEIVQRKAKKSYNANKELVKINERGLAMLDKDLTKYEVKRK